MPKSGSKANPTARPARADAPGLFNLPAQCKSPVIISAVDLVRAEGERFVRVTARDGLTGVTQANDRVENLDSMPNGTMDLYHNGGITYDEARWKKAVKG